MRQDVTIGPRASFATEAAPPVHDHLDCPASLSFVDESEYAALLGALMHPPRVADRDAPRDDAIGESRPRASASPPESMSGVALVSVLLELGAFVTLLAVL